MTARCPACGRPLPFGAAERRDRAVKAGLARAAALSPERRREIAIAAARARWRFPR